MTGDQLTDGVGTLACRCPHASGRGLSDAGIHRGPWPVRVVLSVSPFKELELRSAEPRMFNQDSAVIWAAGGSASLC